jgi:2,4-dienoyl-CoA reductase (NADPH2)
MNLYTGESEEREFDSLVLATTNTPEDRLTKELADTGLEVHAIGDTVAARSASMAFYEGRKLAMNL